MKEVLKLARDWIAERPADRPVSAGKMISIIDRALAQPEQEPTCPKCGNNRQVWTNQITGHKTCHRVGCTWAQPDAFEQGRQEGMKQERALWELSRLGQEIEAQPPLPVHEALKKALDDNAQLVQAIQKTIDENGHLADGDNCTLIDLVNAVKEQPPLPEQPEQPEQEPVAWMHKIDCGPDDRNDFMAYYKRTPGYCIPLYASPPQRQPLTHEQRLDLLIEFAPSKSSWNAESILIDMVEAKHDIKEIK